MPAESIRTRKITAPQPSEAPYEVKPQTQVNITQVDTIVPCEAELTRQTFSRFKEARNLLSESLQLHTAQVYSLNKSNEDLKTEAQKNADKKVTAGKVDSAAGKVMIATGVVVTGTMAAAIAFSVATAGISLVVGLIASGVTLIAGMAAAGKSISDMKLNSLQGDAVAIQEQRAESLRTISLRLDDSIKLHSSLMTNTEIQSTLIKNNNLGRG